jgi:hypothetical protein
LNLDNCTHHIFNPALISAKLIEHQDDCALYVTDNGYKFANCFSPGLPELKGDLDGIFTSLELRNNIKFIGNLEKDKSNDIQQKFHGELDPKTKNPWDKTFKTGVKL